MKNKHLHRALTVLFAGMMSTSFVAGALTTSAQAPSKPTSSTQKTESIRQLDKTSFDADELTKQFLDESVAYQLPETVKSDDEISIIVKMDATENVLDAYNEDANADSVADYLSTRKARKVVSTIESKRNALIKKLNAAGISYVLGESYDVLFSGFEITVKAKDFSKVNKTLGESVTCIVGEVYEPAVTQEVVTNDVNVYDTGIFDSSDSKYDGSGTIIAVLDTGYDYTHTAYSNSPEFFNPSSYAMEEADVAERVGDLAAARWTEGLTSKDVYMNNKIPFAYDYADKDTDVYPIRSEHGTHVAGIIAGHDTVITGVAPNAQLALMKVFSDIQDGAKSSWLLAALEDCVVLGVDVINMSLGSACGFAREVDNAEVADLYDRIKAEGISLVVAASNSYNSTFGSEKNGNLGLTKNPDSATVGSPSTYDASLSVASISGVKTPYLLYGDRIIYFTEASDAAAEQKHFVDELLPEGVYEKEYEYVTVPGIGLNADYAGLDVTGKIALIKRGENTFEDKAKTAQRKGAAGVIIYNNVSGDISMTVGNVTAAVCSISQEDGETLAAKPNGYIKLSRDQVAGPFMSNFSSWGPTPDLGIKPEITAHGGDILSAVPGQDYDRLSGTSMASPNQAGVTALIRQYVKETFPSLNAVQVTERVNQIMMSTTDIAYNTNGLPFAVRKQGSGLANLTKATTSPAYLTTFETDADGNTTVMDKTKLELGDDKDKTGVYTFSFAVNNFGGAALSYDVNAIVMTEGVSDVKTHQGETTVTEKGYMLDGATIVVTSVNGDGSANGNKVTVNANGTLTVTATITLSDADKQYLNDSFENGMYVEGFVTLTAADGGVNLNVPYLAFYGDWTQAPIFDLDYFETNKDELDDSIDLLDKTMADSVATKAIGGLYDDYISYLGGYYFIQDPSSTKISAKREYVALSNQDDAINSIYSVWAGLLRGAAKIVTTITEDSTGEVIYEQVDYNIRKSYNVGSMIYFSSIDFCDWDTNFSVADYNLKNNTKYTVKLQAYVDYGDGGLTTNKRNTFEFPFTTDFEAPTLENCTFRTEYDELTKKTKLYADLEIYDNHYSMAMSAGYVYLNEQENALTMDTFGKYPKPIYSEFNSTTKVTYELTDYIDKCLASYDHDGGNTGNSFIAVCYDYAMNQSIFEIEIPNDIRALYFEETEVTLSPNETYELKPILFPDDEWATTLLYTSTDNDVVRIVGNELIAVAPGIATITAKSRTDEKATASITVTVVDENDPAFKKLDKPVVSEFVVTGYHTDKAFHFISSKDREIGQTNTDQYFSSTGKALSMYPSEAVTLQYSYKAYFPEDIDVVFESSNENIVKIDENGQVTAVGEGISSVTIRLMMKNENGEYVSTYYTQSISVTVKNPYEASSGRLMAYRGNGGTVTIPDHIPVKTIYQYAFSGYDYVLKDATDEYSEEETSKTKISYLGENTITEVILPEGVEEIGAYAFAGLTALESITLPSTIKKIAEGAFYGCTSLYEVKGLEYVKFVNQDAFAGGCILESAKFDSMIAIGNNAFDGNEFTKIVLPNKTQSLGIGAFANNSHLETVTINAAEVKIGSEVFKNCSALQEININAAVIPSDAFAGCKNLAKVTFGPKVSVLGTKAFAGTKVTEFDVSDNENLKVSADKNYLTDTDGDTLILAVPKLKTAALILPDSIKTIATNAFSGNSTLKSIVMNGVTLVEDYAFYGCNALNSVTMNNVVELGNYAFAETALSTYSQPATLASVGAYAFASTNLYEISIPDNTVIGDYAFSNNQLLTKVTIGNGVQVGEGAFLSDCDTENNYVFHTSLTQLTIGDNVVLGKDAFNGASSLAAVTLGTNVSIGERAFYNCFSLETINLETVQTIGDEAFSGLTLYGMNSQGQVTRIFHYSAALKSADLSAVTSLGDSAFAYCEGLKTVTVGGGLTIVPRYAFCGTQLTAFDFTNVTEIGEYAFATTLIETAELSSVATVGSNAFYKNEKLTNVSLKDEAAVMDGAFNGATALTTVNGLDKAVYVGDMAFANTLLTEANVSSAIYLGSLAFYEAPLTSATLCEELAYIGENPFAGSSVPAFTKESVAGEFNGTPYYETVDTFDIGETVKIIDGALYKVRTTGLELVCYPTGTDAARFAVVDGTVRISAYAFYEAKLNEVELPETLQAIGHKAFYGCNALNLVVFNSLVSPILEEEFDTNYQLVTNIPNSSTGYEDANGNPIEGLDISPYYVWNIGNNVGCFYYGANFVDYVGKVDSHITMIYPKNGTGYTSFIFNQYFSSAIQGKATATAVTKEAINAINLIPEKITLADEAIIISARAAYNKVTDHEQRAIIQETNYERLTSAENLIKFLKDSESTEPAPAPNDNNQTKPAQKPVDGLAIWLGIVGGIAVLAIAAIAFMLIKQRTAKEEASAETNDETQGE